MAFGPRLRASQSHQPGGGSKGSLKCSEQFLCSESGGCAISQNKVNDLTCDCPNCENETDAGLDCVQCRCPAVCGQTPEVPACKFRCEFSGCLIDARSVGDASCNCPDCEDEAERGFVCDTELGGFCQCPTACDPQTVFPCSVPPPPPPPPPPPAPSGFACDDGCFVSQDDVDDDYCDCSDCSDEDQHTCDDCTCPTFDPTCSSAWKAWALSFYFVSMCGFEFPSLSLKHN